MSRHPLIARIAAFAALLRPAVVCAIAICVVPLVTHANVMGPSGGYDLDDLMAQAQERYDLAALDAILLLNSLEVSILPNGDRVTRTHQVVWIETEIGIEEYTDHRVPWNTANSTLNVTALRTWRDEQWWPREPAISPTAVVETMPFALDRTDDYTTMREAMLLHDGVELPCVVETAYFIVEKGTAADGADGLYVFAHDDPVVRSRFSLTVPAGTTFHMRSANDAPQPEQSEGGGESDSYVWEMSFVERLGTPHLDDPATYAPVVEWSTWVDWKALGDKITSTLDGATLLTDALKDSVADRIEHEPNEAARARAVADFIDESTRSIRYSDEHWEYGPRTASRTYETAYGHRLDRAVLATALFREAGLDVRPAYHSLSRAGFDPVIPGLSRFGSMHLRLSGDDMQTTYDPGNGTLSDPPDIGATLWYPGLEDRPTFFAERTLRKGSSTLELIITLDSEEDGHWSGSGYLDARGILCPHHAMVGLEREAIGTLSRLAESILDGANVESYNPSTFHRQRVTAGFAISVDKSEPDDQGRTAFAVGSPSGAVMDNLPGNVTLYMERRSSPVLLASPLTQRVQLRIKAGDHEVIRLPEAREVTNGVGSFAVTVEEDDDWITIERTLKLTATTIKPDEWPQLRALLLEETDAGNAAILLK